MQLRELLSKYFQKTRKMPVTNGSEKENKVEVNQVIDRMNIWVKGIWSDFGGLGLSTSE